MKNVLLLLALVLAFSCSNNENVDGENTSSVVVEEEAKKPELPGEMGKREWKLLKYSTDGKEFNLSIDHRNYILEINSHLSSLKNPSNFKEYDPYSNEPLYT